MKLHAKPGAPRADHERRLVERFDSCVTGLFHFSDNYCAPIAQYAHSVHRKMRTPCARNRALVASRVRIKLRTQLFGDLTPVFSMPLAAGSIQQIEK